MRLTLRNTTIVVLTLAIVVTVSKQAIAVTNGEIDAENGYANVGAIVLTPSDPDQKTIVFSSGVLIHERILLTAAHSIEFIEDRLDQGVPLEAFKVSFGVNARDEETWLDISEVVIHPDYNAYSGMYGLANPSDLGVVILADPVDDITPAVLPPAGFLDVLKQTGLLESNSNDGTPLTTVGYGRTLAFPPPETQPIDGYRRFAQSEYLGLTQAFLMASGNPATGYGGGAQGDSGAPIFWTDPWSGEDILVGVHLRSDAERVSIKFEYRTDIPGTREFVEFVIESVELGLF